MENNQLFVWRGSDHFDLRLTSYSNDCHGRDNCPCYYCGENVVRTKSYQGFWPNLKYSSFYKCNFCGWQFEYSSVDEDSETKLIHQYKTLKSFDINSASLTHSELGSYLTRNYNRVHSLTPRKFEKLIADLYKNLGFRVELTKVSHDGGKDLLIFDRNNEKQIVEIKRYKNTVGVQFIRNLLGVQLLEGVKKATLITSSKFSQEAKKVSNSSLIKTGFQIDLIDAEQLLKLLGVYGSNSTLVDIDILRSKFRKL